ncbi:MAG: hypothetical protein HY226_06320 [Candidatus Vogelbacteria bacterium]|nr:hypothetical protein [Candidatus Vogelbacteria bacterium]
MGNNKSKETAPPFEISLFHQTATKRSREILKEDGSVSPEKDDLAVKLKGSGARLVSVDADSGLLVDGRYLEVHPWDFVQLVVTVNLTSQLFVLVQSGEFDFKLKEPIRKSSFFKKARKDGEKGMTEIPSHIFDLINDEEGRSVYLAAVTFVPDPKLEESYVPHVNSGITVVEVVNAYLLHVWRVGLVTLGGVTRLEIRRKEVARPDGLTGKEADKEMVRKFVSENGHVF